MVQFTTITKHNGIETNVKREPKSDIDDYYFFFFSNYIILFLLFYFILLSVTISHRATVQIIIVQTLITREIMEVRTALLELEAAAREPSMGYQQTIVEYDVKLRSSGYTDLLLTNDISLCRVLGKEQLSILVA